MRLPWGGTASPIPYPERVEYTSLLIEDYRSAAGPNRALPPADATALTGGSRDGPKGTEAVGHSHSVQSFH
jgi:hypothetical protein